MNTSTIKVAVVDDEEQVRLALGNLIGSVRQFRHCGSYANAEEALTKIPKHPPDVVMMDIRMPGRSGIECTRRLKQLSPSLSIVMFTGAADRAHFFKALMAGADGYLVKPSTRAEIVESLEQAREGASPFCGQMLQVLKETFRQTGAERVGNELLTPREQEVMVCLLEGSSDKAVAQQLGVGVRTAQNHVYRILRKFAASSRNEAVERFLNL